MIRRRILQSSAILASSIASFCPTHAAKAETSNKFSKELRSSVLARPDLGSSSMSSTGAMDPPEGTRAEKYPWKTNISTTTFWVGEDAAKNNPVPNYQSSWDQNWAKSYGGTDDPEDRAEYLPAKFVPKQNPFYIALPYNDMTRAGHKPEASKVIPWFKEEFQSDHKTVLKGRWIAIRYKDKVAYAQWEDCGPFRTDHYQYVFGNERPKPNLNKGAGLDVSPAVRDFLGMKSSDVTDWKFVDFAEVPNGPWAQHGDNNTFVINKRKEESRVASADTKYRPSAATSPVGPSIFNSPLPKVGGIPE
jgi:hypothetical protein